MSVSRLLKTVSTSFFRPSGLISVSENVCRSVISSYQAFNGQEKKEFIAKFASLQADRLKDVNIHAVDHSLDEKTRVKKLFGIYKTIKPSYRNLFHSMGRVPDGVRFLMLFREDILKFILENQTERSQSNVQAVNSPDAYIDSVRFMDQDLKDVLTSWFCAGILHLERLTWDSSSSLLQRVADYEAVHPVRSWMDMKRRVGPYRRSFIYTHPSMPGIPLVILHTALCHDIVASMENLTLRNSSDTLVESEDEEELKKRKAVIFYSISSPHLGLKGIDLGNSIIKQVVLQLKSELPSLDMFSTLSPIPGFSKWLMAELHRLEEDAPVIPPLETLILEVENVKSFLQKTCVASTAREIRDVLTDIKVRKPDYLRDFLLRLCCHYLMNEKHRGSALDPVANFHLRNGAVLWRINWKADSSPRISSQSYGIMVNYRYYVNELVENSENYVERQKIVASDEVHRLLGKNSKL